MADPKGFIKYSREVPPTRKVEDRIKDYKEIYEEVSPSFITKQATRCMDCGIPFCNSGCPLGNLIPDFNDAVYKEDWRKAYEVLSLTNNFPEFTGRICPAPCEAACVLGINEKAVSIENIEKHIIEKAFSEGWVNIHSSKECKNVRIAIIGSGPAGLAAADQLNNAGYAVTVYERNEKPGGLLRYGIPDFKLEKWVVERRVEYMEKSGVRFINHANVGFNVKIKDIREENDAILLCGGSTIPRDLNIEGREATGVHFAMDFLEQSNKYVDNKMQTLPAIFVKDKKVVVIGGGDTGADCVGTSIRQGASTVVQIELLGKPGSQRTDKDPWPLWPMTLRTSSSHEEGCTREWAIMTKRFIKSKDGKLKGIEIADISWDLNESTGQYGFTEIEGSSRILECDIVFIAAGFLHPQKEGIIDQLNIELDNRGNIKTNNYQTNQPDIFAAGDMRRGQSLVVWAIHEGREAARAVDMYLNKTSMLNAKTVNHLVMT